MASDALEESEEVRIITQVMNEKTEVNPIERGVSALLAFHNRNAVGAKEEEEEVVPEIVDESHINIFHKVRLGQDVKTLIEPANLERFGAPLINKAFIKDKIELLERVLGRSGQQAHAMTNEILKDMLNATDYPPDVTGLFLSVEEVTLAAQQLADYVASLKAPKE